MLRRMGQLLVAWLGALMVFGCVSTTSSTMTNMPGSSGSVSATNSSANGESDARRRARARLELAVGYYSNGQLAIAVEELQNAIKADPAYHEAHGMLGIVYMRLGDVSAAEQSFRQALALAPTDPEINNNYGWFLCQRGQTDEAIDHFQIALKNPLYPTPAVGWRNQGLCLERATRLDAALEALQRSFQLDPGNAITTYALASLALRRGELERAIFHAQRLNRQFEPTAASLWLELRIERKRGNTQAVQTLGAQLKRRYPESAEAAAWMRGAFDD